MKTDSGGNAVSRTPLGQEPAPGGPDAGGQGKTGIGPYGHPMADAVHAADNGNAQGFQPAAAMGDKPAQKMSLKEKLAAFKVT